MYPLNEFFRRVAKLIFVLALGLSLTTLLAVELWWWYSETAKKESVVSAGFQSGWGRKITQSAVGEEETEALISGQILSEDARPLIIENYLRKYNSPLLPYSRLIFELSQTYGFEYYWIVAIAQQESNLCKKIPEGSHNCWGYGIHKKGTLKFENYELALKSYAEYLKREYFDKGYLTTEQIMKKYCPSSDGSWARGVNQFIGELESGQP